MTRFRVPPTFDTHIYLFACQARLVKIDTGNADVKVTFRIHVFAEQNKKSTWIAAAATNTTTHYYFASFIGFNGRFLNANYVRVCTRWNFNLDDKPEKLLAGGL